MDLAPKTAIVLRDGKEIEIGIEQVQVGDILPVRPGQRVPVDGVLLEGSSAVDESALTGESLPVEKQAGDKLYTASINKTGYFTMRAEKLARIRRSPKSSSWWRRLQPPKRLFLSWRIRWRAFSCQS